MMLLSFRSFSRAAFATISVPLLGLVLALPVAAQQPVVTDTMYLHAHGLVSRGQGAEGRALIDSLLLATAPGTPAYAEGLFWRAVTASRVEDAERDYLRIVIEFPLSSRSEDALIRLAELEMMRGDRTRAQRHLQRLIIEHPNGAARARASYWLARVFFEGNDLPRACNELNVARARAAASDVELRNQVDYQAQRCVGVNVVIAPAPAPVPTQNSGASSQTSAGGGLLPAPASTTARTASTGIGSGAVGAGLPSVPNTISSGAPPPAANTPPSVTVAVVPPAAPITNPGISAGSPASAPATSGPTAPVPPASTSSPTRPAPVPAASPVSAPISSTAPGSGSPTAAPVRRSQPEFTVQVAAFPTKAAADTFMESLRAKGYDVRVWGTEYPFRVRIGRFATRAEAAAIAQELRTRMISKDAFVAEAEVR